MRMTYLYLVFSLFSLGKLNAGPCADLSLGGCLISKESLIDVINIPDSEDSEFQCQTVCASIETCSHFRYDHSLAECSLLTNFEYQASCDIYSGPGTPHMADCFSGEAFENSCDGFRYDGCSFSGEVVFNEDNVKDWAACENLQVTLGPVYGANAFVYDGKMNNNCKLYKNINRYECTTFSGPKSPDFRNCEAETTTLKPTTFAPSPPGPNIIYHSCSEDELPLEILNSWVSPYPIVAPSEGGGSFEISVTVVLEEELPANSKLNLTVYVWLESQGEYNFYPIGCYDDISDIRFGSCMYDIQELLNAWSDALCPVFLPSGQECKLPLKPGVYGGKHTVHLFDHPEDCFIQFPFPLGSCNCVDCAAAIWKAEARTILEDGTEFSCIRWFYEIKNNK